MNKYNRINTISFIIGILSLIITIWVAYVADKVNKRIEFLTIGIDAVTRETKYIVEMVYEKVDNMSTDMSKLPPATNITSYTSQVQKTMDKGAFLLDNKKYKEAIDEFNKAVKQEPEIENIVYYNIAKSYAKWSKTDIENKNEYLTLMLSNLKKAAHLGNEDAKRLLEKYKESW